MDATTGSASTRQRTTYGEKELAPCVRLLPPRMGRNSSFSSEAVLYTVPCEFRPDNVHRAKSGDVVLKTENPLVRPLPSLALLGLHWCLSRMMTMPGIDIVEEDENGGKESGEESSQGSSEGSSDAGSDDGSREGV